MNYKGDFIKILVYIICLISFIFSEYKIVPNDGDDNDAFGNSISMNNNWIAISANKDEPNGDNSGSVYLYKLDGNIIVDEQKIYPSDGDFNDYFGKSISLFGFLILRNLDTSCIDIGNGNNIAICDD